MSTISPAHKAAAHVAVTPRPAGKHDSALKTPSWTAIVESYHQEGNGDREMLLALLQAKAKEDERLAALDLLRAEQLRAYTAHLSVHGPMFHPGAAPIHSPQHQASYYHYSAANNAGIASTSTSAASTSTSTATSSSHHRRAERANASRSPSLSHSAGSRLSSPELARTPDDERRLSELSLSDSSTRQQGLLLPPMRIKRKADDGSGRFEEEEEGRSSPNKRVSPSRQLPSLSKLLPPSQQQQHNHHIQHRSASPKSLQHILNEELRPLSLSGFRVATSDVRSSSSDEDELDEDA